MATSPNEHPLLPLTPRQSLIRDCVAAHPGLFTISGLAKLLVGSQSQRVSDSHDSLFYGRFRGHKRKQVAGEITSTVICLFGADL